MRYIALPVLALLLFSPLALAVVTFNQLDDDTFTVSHLVKGIGSRGKAMTVVLEKASSLCVAAGYTHLKILQQESQAAGEDDTANASVRVRFFLADGEDRIECERNADPKYIEQAQEKLAKAGYRPPAPADEVAPQPAGEAPDGPGSCTLEQIAAMARSGLSDAQIRAACTGQPNL